MADGIQAHITSSNDVIQSLILRFATELEEKMAGDVLFYKGPIVPPLDELIRDALESKAQEKKRKKLVFVLETNGGLLEVVVRIVDTLRYHYPDCVEFIVPNHAFSAGTVLVLSGNDIYMDYFSVLGPTDPQDMDASGRFIPALGYVERYEKLIKKAAEPNGLTAAEVTLLVEGFDQGRLQMFEHYKDLATSLVKDWLPKYKFKDWTETETSKTTVDKAMREQRAGEIAESLSNTARWHSHGRGINMEVLRREINLKISDFGTDDDLNKCIRQFNGLMTDFASRIGAQVFLYTPGRLVAPGAGID